MTPENVFWLMFGLAIGAFITWHTRKEQQWIKEVERECSTED